MRHYLNNLPKEIRDLIAIAQDISCSVNMPVCLVGGFVRDLLLGVKNLDLDIVVDGDGMRFAQELALHLKGKLIQHRRFGTATVSLSPNLKIDIATSRKEFYPEPAHLPVVSKGSLEDDLYRRDFTVNALALDISCENFGKLIDFFGGKVDLDNKKIRILHNLSFIDDPTRILRAIRFEKRYNFKIEPRTLKKLKDAVSLKMLEAVSPHRMRDELILALKEGHPLKVIRRLRNLAGFNFISPKIKLRQKDYKLFSAIEKQISWYRMTYPCRRPIDAWLIYLIAILDSLSINESRKILQRFAFRKGEEKRVLDYKKNNRNLSSKLKREKIKPSKIFAMLGPLSYEVTLIFKAKYKNRRIQRHIENFFKVYNDIRILTSGYDLQKIGILPGPRYQKIFKKMLMLKLDGKVATKEEELQYIKKIIRKVAGAH